MSKKQQSVIECLRSAVFTSSELQALTGLGQPAVSRQIQALGNRVVKLPNGRHPKYSLTCDAFGSGDRIPLYAVDAYGNSTTVAYIRPLAHGGFFVELQTGASTLLNGEGGTAVFDDLPYYLQDLRPQGFLGRQIATELSNRSEEFPADPRRWNSNQVGRYLLSNGDDLPGNFQLGLVGILRTRRAPVVYSRTDYAHLAESIIAGELPGSSAGGEQPKFTVFSEDRAAWVIVKFSPAGNDPIAIRWRDILISEYHATEELHAWNVPAAETELVVSGDRLFLESARFDRIGTRGRASMISLQSIDAEFVGNGADWPIVVKQLRAQKLLTDELYFDACILWEFGYLINNTDMHLGNLSFGMDGNAFDILPVYDMCSMGFAPLQGVIKPFAFKLNNPTSRLNTLADMPEFQKEIQPKVYAMAKGYWERVAADSRISDEFRSFLVQGNPLERQENQLRLL